MTRRWLTPLMAAVLAAPTAAQRADDLPAYVPGRTVEGVIRSWGNDRMSALMTRWEAAFRGHHPDVRFETRLLGTGTAMAGLYTGVADLAVMGRPSNATENMAFEWVFQYKPVGIQVSTGSLGSPGKSYAPVVIVHKDNPITQLTMVQLDAVFGCEHRRGPRNFRTWGDLGLTGEWRDTPLSVYAHDIQSSTAAFFRQAVLDDSYKWNCDMTEYQNTTHGGAVADDGVVKVADAVARDRAGIGLSALGVVTPGVKVVPLCCDADGRRVAATVETVQSRRYPLSRATWIVVNRAPGKPLAPAVLEFLRFVLSAEGQDAVAREGDYLPLTADLVREQLRALQ